MATNETFSAEAFILGHRERIDMSYVIDTKKLGQGTYGSVSKAVHKDTGSVRAVKSIQKKSVSNRDRFAMEIDIMKKMDHPNVIKLFEHFEDNQNIYLVMELSTGGELFDRIIDAGCFSERDAAVLVQQILGAVYYCHSNKIMHRDLKPENFLFHSPQKDSPLKLIDFGLAAVFEPGQLFKTKAGTPYYVAPQVLQGSYDEKCDVWSIAVIMYIFFCGYPPFYGDTDSEILTKVRSGKFDFPPEEWSKVSPEAKNLITRMLTMDPAKRPSAQEALQDVWVQNYGPSSQAVIDVGSFTTNLRKFAHASKFKKMALHIIAKNLNTKKVANLTKIFQKIDTNKDGTLSIKEMKEGLMAMNDTTILQDMDELLRKMDTDGSGIIEYTEFLAAAMDIGKVATQEVCWTAFRVFDLDGNGKITKDELAKVLNSDEHNIQNAKELIAAHDLDGDGEISFHEFMMMMNKEE